MTKFTEQQMVEAIHRVAFDDEHVKEVSSDMKLDRNTVNSWVNKYYDYFDKYTLPQRPKFLERIFGSKKVVEPKKQPIRAKDNVYDWEYIVQNVAAYGRNN